MALGVGHLFWNWSWEAPLTLELWVWIYGRGEPSTKQWQTWRGCEWGHGVGTLSIQNVQNVHIVWGAFNIEATIFTARNWKTLKSQQQRVARQIMRYKTEVKSPSEMMVVRLGQTTRAAVGTCGQQNNVSPEYAHILMPQTCEYAPSMAKGLCTCD